MRGLAGCAVFCVVVVFSGCAPRMVGSGVASEFRYGEPEIVARFDAMLPTGVAVYRRRASEAARVFVNFPRWGGEVPFTVGEVVDGEALPYPNRRMNRGDVSRPRETLISVQSLVVCPRGLLWLLDTGSVEFGPVVPEGGKLVAVDPESGEVVNTIVFPRDVALETTYLNDVRFDYTRGVDGLAYVTDSSLRGENAIIVADLATGESWRKLAGHESVEPDAEFVGWVEGRPFLYRPDAETRGPVRVGADGLALSADGERLWFTALGSRRLWSVSLDALAGRFTPDAVVERSLIDHGDRGFASDGLESDEQGRVYFTNYEDNGVVVRETDGSYFTLLHDPRMLWPDTLDLGLDGWLYVTTNQLHRGPDFQNGVDRRRPPYLLWRTRVRATPVRLGE